LQEERKRRAFASLRIPLTRRQQAAQCEGKAAHGRGELHEERDCIFDLHQLRIVSPLTECSVLTQSRRLPEERANAAPSLLYAFR